MKKKVKKFGRGGDILTGIGAAIIGKHLYDKFKGDEGKVEDLKPVGGYERRAESAREQYDRLMGKKDEPKAETKEPSAGEKRAMAASKGRPELIPEGADVPTMHSDKNVKRAGDKKNRPAAQTTATDIRRNKAAAQPTTTDTSKAEPSYTDVVPSKDLGSQSFSSGPLKSKPYPQAEATARLKKAEAQRRAGQGLTPRAEYTGPGSRQHVEALRLRRSQQLEEEAKKQFEKNKRENEANRGMKRGGAVKKYASGGSVSSASKRADGIAQRGKTRGRVL